MVIIKTLVLSENGLIEFMTMTLKFDVISREGRNYPLLKSKDKESEQTQDDVVVINTNEIDTDFPDANPWDGYKLHTKVSDWLEDNNIGKVTLEGIEFESEEDMLQFQMKWMTKW